MAINLETALTNGLLAELAYLKKQGSGHEMKQGSGHEMPLLRKKIKLL